MKHILLGSGVQPIFAKSEDESEYKRINVPNNSELGRK